MFQLHIIGVHTEANSVKTIILGNNDSIGNYTKYKKDKIENIIFLVLNNHRAVYCYSAVFHRRCASCATFFPLHFYFHRFKYFII